MARSSSPSSKSLPQLRPQSEIFVPSNPALDMETQIHKARSQHLPSRRSSPRPKSPVKIVPGTTSQIIIIPTSPSPSASGYSSDVSSTVFSASSRKDSLISTTTDDEDYGKHHAAKATAQEQWLANVVLQLYDVQDFDWMMIAEPIQRIWGVKTSSAEVLRILQFNGRIHTTMWWD